MLGLGLGCCLAGVSLAPRFCPMAYRLECKVSSGWVWGVFNVEIRFLSLLGETVSAFDD